MTGVPPIRVRLTGWDGLMTQLSLKKKKPISRILSRSPFFKEQMNPVDGECLKE
jgi:hypothetical protein